LKKNKKMKKIAILLSAIVFVSCMAKKPDDKADNKNQNKENTEVVSENTQSANITKVKILAVTPQEFKHKFTVSAAVEAVKYAAISPEMNGRITKIFVSEGQVVAKGTLLAQLDDRLFQSQLKSAQIGLELADTLYNKQKELWDKKIGTEVQFLQVKNRKESLENQIATLKVQISMTQIRAPFSGIVDRIYQKEGEIANPARQLFDFVNLSELYINTDVSEDYIGKVKRGDDATITFPAFPDLKIKTKVYRSGNIINPSSRSFRVRFRIANTKNRIKPNLVAKVLLSDYQSDKALLVPSIVIQRDMQGEFVYKAEKSNGKTFARKQYIKTGLSEGANTQVTGGINAGDNVIVEGYNLVRKDQQIAVEK